MLDDLIETLIEPYDEHWKWRMERPERGVRQAVSVKEQLQRARMGGTGFEPMTSTV